MIRSRTTLMTVGAVAGLALAGGAGLATAGATAAPAALHVSAAKSGLKFVPAALTAKAGKVTFVFTNPSKSIKHDLLLEKAGSKTELGGTKRILGGKSSSFTVTLKKGTYTYYCSVPGHEAAGMKGTLVVK